MREEINHVTMHKSHTKSITFVCEKATAVYVFFMLSIFPLTFHSGYFDILDTKWLACVVPTVLYILIMSVLIIASRIGAAKTKALLSALPADKTNPLRDSTVDRIFLLLTASYIISVILGMLACDHRLISFWGLTGRYMGVMVVVPLTIAMLLTSRYFRKSRIVLYGAAISSVLNFVLQILNEFMIDPLNMWDGIAPDQMEYFAGTIGNLNFNAVYNVMMLSLAMAFYITKEDDCGAGKISGNSDAREILLVLYIVIGSSALVCTRSDGAFLGLTALLTVLLVHAVRTTNRADRFLKILIMNSLGFAVTAVLYSCVDSAHRFEMNSLPALALNPIVIAAIFIIAAITLAIHSQLYQGNRISTPAMRVVLILPVFFSLFVAIFCAFNNGNAIINILDISDHAAHNRMFVWRNTIGMMDTYSPFEFLFGCGINEFGPAFGNYCGADMLAQGYNVFIDAHSEYLQALATTGIAGAIGYFGMIAALLIAALNGSTKAGRSSSLIAVSFFAAFLVQGLVYSPQITTTPLLFVIMGLLRSQQLRQRG